MYKINEIYDIYIIYLHIYLHIYIYIYILNYDIYLHAIDHKQRKYRLILYERTRKSLLIVKNIPLNWTGSRG